MPNNTPSADQPRPTGRDDRPTVVVLAGGLSHEREVSLKSGRRVATALRDAGHEVIESDVNADLVKLLTEHRDVVVFPLLHGETGEDGSLREVLDLLTVPFVGTGPRRCRVAFDKAVANTIVADAGVQVPRQIALPHDVFRELGASALVTAMAEQVGFPMMVKPSRSGSALGCTKVTSAEELPKAMVAAYAYGTVAVIEEFIEGTELTVAVIDRGDGPVALPAVEIRPESGVYDYTARYTAGATRFLCPAEVDDAVADACAQLALTVHRSLGLADLSRTDIIVGTDGPVFLETNVAPGMTETSAVPIALEAAGFDLPGACSDLVTVAAARADGA